MSSDRDSEYLSRVLARAEDQAKSIGLALRMSRRPGCDVAFEASAEALAVAALGKLARRRVAASDLAAWDGLVDGLVLRLEGAAEKRS